MNYHPEGANSNLASANVCSRAEGRNVDDGDYLIRIFIVFIVY